MLGITEVIENLYISGLETRQAILNKGIRCVINISSECPIQDLGPTVEYEKVSLLDLPTTSIQPYFDRLTARIHQNIQQGKRTLVHCYVGRSRSASIILAYLMKYKQMSLREAFNYLRSRRPIIGPNFGFIKQLIAYERSIFGYVSVSFVNTSFGSVPDIYLTTTTPRPVRPQTRLTLTHQKATAGTIGRSLSSATKSTTSNSSPVRSSFTYSSSPTLTPQPRQNSLVNRSSTITVPGRSITALSSYANTHNQATTSSNNRPVSSIALPPNPVATNVATHAPSTNATATNHTANSISNRQHSSEPLRINSTAVKPFEVNRETVIPNRISTYRTVKYVPSAYNRYRVQ